MADSKHNKPPVEPFINWSRVPRNWIWVTVILINFSLVPLSLVYAHRNLNRFSPRTSIIPDMDNQYRWNAQQYNADFADGRVMRSWPDGTVAQGMLNEDDHYYRGIIDGRFATDFPDEVSINAELIDRGEDRYRIYCAVCHGEGGYGDGMVAQRAQELALAGTAGMSWTPPLSYHTDDIRNRPVGHIFNTITNGVNSMPAYKSQIPVADRWAIVAYIRTLQLSQWNDVSEVDASKREGLRRQIEAAVAAMETEEAAAASGSSSETSETDSAEGAEGAAAADETAQPEDAETQQADADGGNA